MCCLLRRTWKYMSLNNKSILPSKLAVWVLQFKSGKYWSIVFIRTSSGQFEMSSTLYCAGMIKLNSQNSSAKSSKTVWMTQFRTNSSWKELWSLEWKLRWPEPKVRFKPPSETPGCPRPNQNPTLPLLLPQQCFLWPQSGQNKKHFCLIIIYTST